MGFSISLFRARKARKHLISKAPNKLHTTVATSDVSPAHKSEPEALRRFAGRAKCGWGVRERAETRAPQRVTRARSAADVACYVEVQAQNFKSTRRWRSPARPLRLHKQPDSLLTSFPIVNLVFVWDLPTYSFKVSVNNSNYQIVLFSYFILTYFF